MQAGSTPSEQTSTANPANAGPSGQKRYWMYFALAAVLVLALLGMNLLAFSGRIQQRISESHYYLVLGDSIAFGYQPDLTFTEGFADDVSSYLRGYGVVDDVNYACVQESTATMITGDCPLHFLHHDAYTGSHLYVVLDRATRAGNAASSGQPRATTSI